jgi:hypothetical protein
MAQTIEAINAIAYSMIPPRRLRKMSTAAITITRPIIAK